MKVARTTIYLCIVFTIQWVIMILLPYLFFKYLASLQLYPANIFVDQFVKAVISFTLVGLWLYEWMKLREYLYRSLSR